MTTDNSPITIQLTDNGVMTYTPADFLGRGVLGDVFYTNDRQFVVKVPRDAGARLTEFKREQALLTHLLSTNAVPPIFTGTIAQVGLNLPVIVMPFYAKADLLTEHLNDKLAKGDYLEAERDLMPSLIAFCDVMLALHTYKDAQTDKRYTCTDRKVGDFYRVNNKPIIIDWNVLSDYDDAFRNAEIRVFGTIIHEFYFGSKGNPPYEPFNDRHWLLPNGEERGAISVGLRYLMARMVQNPTYYAQAGEVDYFIQLKHHLTAWQAVLDGCLDSLSALQIDNPLYADAIRDDMRWRLGQGDGDARDLALRKAYESALTPSQQLRNAVLDKLNFTLKDAQDFLNSYTPPATLDDDDKQILLSHVGRWKVLLGYTDDGFESRKKAEIRAKLIPQIGGLLHTETALNATQLDLIGKEFDRLRKLLPNHDLSAIEHEIALHQQAETFHRTLHPEKRAEALRHIRWKPDQTPHLKPELLNRILDGYFIQALYDQIDLADDADALAIIHRDLTIAMRVAGWDEWLKTYFEALQKAVSFVHTYQPVFTKTVTFADLEAHPHLLSEADECLKALTQSNAQHQRLFTPTITTIRANYLWAFRKHVADLLLSQPHPSVIVLFRALTLISHVKPFLTDPSDTNLVAEFNQLVAHNLNFLEDIHQVALADTISPDLAKRLLGAIQTHNVDVSLLTITEPTLAPAPSSVEGTTSHE